MAPSEIIFDDTQWPVLIITHPEEASDKQQTIEYLERLDSFYNKGEKFIPIFDVSGARPPTAEHRYMVVTWIKAHETKISKCSLGIACVVSNLVQRMALIAIFRFTAAEAIKPVKVFSSLEEATKWARARIKSA